MGKRGPRPRGAAYHVMVGNYRPSVHGPRPVDIAKAEAEANDPWKTILRLDYLPRPRPLDPIEELLQREGIEITDADRRSAKK